MFCKWTLYVGSAGLKMCCPLQLYCPHLHPSGVYSLVWYMRAHDGIFQKFSKSFASEPNMSPDLLNRYYEFHQSRNDNLSTFCSNFRDESLGSMCLQFINRTNNVVQIKTGMIVLRVLLI